MVQCEGVSCFSVSDFTMYVSFTYIAPEAANHTHTYTQTHTHTHTHILIHTHTHTPQSHVHRGGGSEPDQRAHTTMRDRARDTAGDHDDVDAHEHLCDGGVGVGKLAHVDDEERGGDDPVGVASPADGL